MTFHLHFANDFSFSLQSSSLTFDIFSFLFSFTLAKTQHVVHQEQHVELEEPVFANTIGDREAREYNRLAKMDLGDTFDHDDIDR